MGRYQVQATFTRCPFLSMPPLRPIEQPKRYSAIRRFLLVFLFAVTLGSIIFMTYCLTRPEPPNAYAQAAALDAIIHQDSRFVNVRAMCAGGNSTIVLAPEELPNDARASLEKIVHERTLNPRTEVHYIPW